MKTILVTFILWWIFLYEYMEAKFLAFTYLAYFYFLQILTIHAFLHRPHCYVNKAIEVLSTCYKIASPHSYF